MLPFCWSMVRLFQQGGVFRGSGVLLSTGSFRCCSGFRSGYCGDFRCCSGFRSGYWVAWADFGLDRAGLSSRSGVGGLGSSWLLASCGVHRGGVRLGACRGVLRSWFWVLLTGPDYWAVYLRLMFALVTYTYMMLLLTEVFTHKKIKILGLI